MLKKEDINNYGIVYTPEILVNKILNLIPQSFFSDKNMRWLDIGAGCGAFSINLYNRLLNDLSNNFNNIEETKNHIIKNMIFMVEIYPEHIKILEDKFGK
jgi:methylase of polypeptide subunit release factors